MIYDTTSVLYNRLSLLRNERSVSRRDLADAVGVNAQTVGYIERGDYGPSLELALKLSAYFGVTVDLMFSLTPFAPLAEQLRAAPPSQKNALKGEP